MKFIHYLKGISGVSIYPMTGLLLFVIFFTGVTWYVFGSDKQKMERNGKIPLE